jgi:hypothetical protein
VEKFKERQITREKMAKGKEQESGSDGRGQINKEGKIEKKRKRTIDGNMDGKNKLRKFGRK